MTSDSYRLFFRCMGSPTRMAIVDNLRNGPMSVKAICSATGFEQSRASHALTHLTAMGFISSVRDGKFRVYTLDCRVASALGEVASFMESHRGRLCTCGILKGREKCRHIRGKNGKAKDNKD